jgi:hypothetical protein
MRHGRNPREVLLLAVFFLAAAGPPAVAGEEAGEPPSIESLARELREMQKRMESMQRRHEEETRALREELDRLRAGGGQAGEVDEELARILREADEEIAESVGEAGEPGETTFIARGLGLQALNPEISVAGDLLTIYRDREDERSDTDLKARVFDVHVESYLDPYSKLKAAIGVFPDKTVLGEGYVTRFGVLPDLNVTAGKFRQPLGVVNRWHKHALDQVDFPLPLRMIFGDGGLNQTGFSFEWKAPELWGGSQEVILQITEGENGRVFGENSRHLPCGLLRFKHFRDLTKDTWAELGLTCLAGVNDRFDVGDGHERDRRSAFVLGADLTVRWEPTERMRHANFEWRTELYRLDKGILAPDGSGPDRLRAWGAYTSLQRKLSRTVDVGMRFDYYRPDRKDYAAAGGLDPLAYSGKSPCRWLAAGYVTWMQSPFVKVRFEVDYSDGRRTGGSELVFVLQIVFAAGPHKHERY